MRLNEPAEIRQMGQLALAPQQQASKLLLELLDCARQRRLRDIASLRRSCEVQGLGHRQEVADLVHLHTGTLPRIAASHKSRPGERPRVRAISSAHRNDRRPAFPSLPLRRYLSRIEIGRAKWTSGKAGLSGG